MLTDEVKLCVRAGRGGDGVVRFSGVMKTNAPTGGDGGKGGNVILLGVEDLGALRAYRSKKPLVATDGKNGQQNTKKGHDGKDIFVRVPVGTVAFDREKDKHYEIVHVGQEVVVAKGGNGGYGNFHFRSSRRTTPQKATPGQDGEEVFLDIELQLIADIGFIGYPNVGKSSLMNALTNASSKVGNYQFTTLEPHLGVHYGTILADIPGLIEGASEGRGLGHKFLRHIERTRVLFHFVSAGSEDPLADYTNVREELNAYNTKLLEKPEWIILSRADECDEKEIQQKVNILKQKNPHIIVSSILDESRMKEVEKVITQIGQKSKKEEEI